VHDAIMNRKEHRILEDSLRSALEPLPLDVSTPKEYREARIESSRNVPISQLREQIAEVPSDRTVVVFCRTGYRSAMALGILEQCGRDDVMHLVGGMAAWKTSGLPTTT
jgi:rhodanese-related sulfurtransferase